MGRELSHEEATDLLGAYALDALEPAELQTVDRHVQGCQACLAEISQHREVAGLLTPGWSKPPPGLWERISASLEEAPPPLDLAPVIAMKERKAAPQVAPRRSFGAGIAAMVAVAAMVMVGFLGFSAVDNGGDDTPGGTYAQELQRSVNAALAAPYSRKVDLVSADGYKTAQAVVLPDGTGYLVKNNLPVLSDERTYQLWAVVGSSAISVGVLGSEPKIVPFKMDGPVSALASTEESAGGVISSKKEPIVQARIQAA